jgi:hypothetical protein
MARSEVSGTHGMRGVTKQQPLRQTSHGRRMVSDEPALPSIWCSVNLQGAGCRKSRLSVVTAGLVSRAYMSFAAIYVIRISEF